MLKKHRRLPVFFDVDISLVVEYNHNVSKKGVAHVNTYICYSEIDQHG